MSLIIVNIFLKFRLYTTIGQNIIIDKHCMVFKKFGEYESLNSVINISIKIYIEYAYKGNPSGY